MKTRALERRGSVRVTALFRERSLTSSRRHKKGRAGVIELERLSMRYRLRAIDCSKKLNLSTELELVK